MQFSMITVTALFGALAAAAPGFVKQSETNSVQGFSLRQNNSVVEAASFTLQPANISCSATTAEELTSTVGCGNGYSFYLSGSNLSEYNLITYKETGPVAGLWGQNTVPVYCHAGGDGPTDFACIGVAQVNITMKNY